MLYLSQTELIASSGSVDGKEFTRYFSGFPLTSLDQEMVCYHKKNIVVKCWKDIGSGIEIFRCRQHDENIVSSELIALCKEYGTLLIRNGVVDGLQVHIPLTGKFIWQEDYFNDIVSTLWQKGYVIVQTVIQTREFPLIQWSITDPTILETLVSHLKDVETDGVLPIIKSIATVERRKFVLWQFFAWCEEHNHDASLFETYDIMPLRCDS